MNNIESGTSPGAAAPMLPPERLCANCAAAAPREYCSECGQETREPPTPADFLRESLEHFLKLESKAWRTLLRLLFAPGQLTIDYVAGRRVRYVRPLRLYLWISVLTIAIIEAFGLHVGIRFFGEEGIYLFEPSTRASAGGKKTHAEELRPMQFVLNHFDTPGLRRFKSLSTEEQVKFVQERRHQYVQYFTLLLVPVYAWMVQLCYRNRRRPYVDHLVFCLHVQSFLFIVLLIEAKLPGPLALVVSLWLIAYVFAALKRVYGGSLADTLLRGASTLVLNIATFLVTGSLLVYALLEF